MRWLLVQVAVSILRRRPPQAEALHAWALHIAARRVASRRGTHIAVVTLARRVAGILSALLRDGTTFDPRRAPRPVVAATLPAKGTVAPERALRNAVLGPGGRRFLGDR